MDLPLMYGFVSGCHGPFWLADYTRVLCVMVN